MGLLSQRAVATYGGRDLLHGGALRKNGETCLPACCLPVTGLATHTAAVYNLYSDLGSDETTR